MYNNYYILMYNLHVYAMTDLFNCNVYNDHGYTYKHP